MVHSEIQICPKCNLKMQLHGNLIHIDDFTYQKTNSEKDEFDKGLIDVYYSENYTRERLKYNNYKYRDYMVCPLCKNPMDKIGEGDTRTCATCNLRMTAKYNDLIVFIKNSDLEFYTSVNKYNL